jgi:acyl-CoA thioesterase-1
MHAPVLLALRGLLLLGFSLVLSLALSLALSLYHGAAIAAAPEGSAGAESNAAELAPTVLVLGDSISAAYGMSLEQGWVSLIESRLRESFATARVVNASISGDTSSGGLRRLPALLTEHEPDLLVIELGGNDGLRGYPTSGLRDNLVSMASLAKATGAAVLILPMEMPPNYGSRYTSAFRKAFVDAARETGAELGPFPLDNVATHPELMQNDGIHPTVEAQALIADRLLPAITAMLLTETRS